VKFSRTESLDFPSSASFRRVAVLNFSFLVATAITDTLSSRSQKESDRNEGLQCGLYGGGVMGGVFVDLLQSEDWPEATKEQKIAYPAESRRWLSTALTAFFSFVHGLADGCKYRV
jgi:hypothetical protein